MFSHLRSQARAALLGPRCRAGPRFRARILALAAALLAGVLTAGPAGAQPADSLLSARRASAIPADVESPEAIVTAVYESISGDAGEARNWDRFRSLFVPEARLIPTGRSNGEAGYTVFTPEEYVERVGPALRKDGFYERQSHAVTERFGDVAHVFSTYESRRAPSDAEPFQRGINSFQLWYDGERWWIVSIFWHAEREGAAIPERYGG